MKIFTLLAAALLTLGTQAFGSILIYNGTQSFKNVVMQKASLGGIVLLVDTANDTIVRIPYNKQLKEYTIGGNESVRRVRPSAEVNGEFLSFSVIGKAFDNEFGENFSTGGLFLRGKNFTLPLSSGASQSNAKKLTGTEKILSASGSADIAVETTFLLKYDIELTTGANTNSETMNQAIQRVRKFLEAKGYSPNI
jgi:hypothetical protein